MAGGSGGENTSNSLAPDPGDGNSRHRTSHHPQARRLSHHPTRRDRRIDEKMLAPHRVVHLVRRNKQEPKLTGHHGGPAEEPRDLRGDLTGKRRGQHEGIPDGSAQGSSPDETRLEYRLDWPTLDSPG